MLKILIVDDDQQNRYMLETLLRGNGYEVVVATNGAEALDVTRHDPPDIIISDILMPVMDGFTLCRHWKADEQLSDIPFIFYSATYTDPQDEDLALSLGAERFIVKPAEPDEFIKILREVLAERKAGALVARHEPPPEEMVYYKKYNAVLIDKLEDKLVQLEEANRALTQEIEERKRVEQALRDSEASFRLLFANNPNSMWVYDLETLAFLEVNEMAVADYGYSRAEFLQIRITDIYPAEDVPLLLENIERIGVELQISGEWRHRLKNGNIINVAMVSHTLEFAGRQAVLVVARNITKRKQAEMALRESEERFRRLAEHAPDIIYRYRLTPVPGFEYVSPAATAITGYSPEEYYADPELGLKLVYPDDQPLVQQLAGGQISPEPLMLRWVRKDGRMIWNEQRNVPIYDKTGILIAIEGIARDITDRKQAEEALRLSEARFRATFEQAAVGLSHVAPDGRWLWVNQKLCEIVGYTREELLQKSFQEITHPDDLETDLERVHRVLAGEIETYSIEKRYFRQDGSIIWVDLTVSLVHHPSGEPDYFVSVIQDISQRKQMEAALQAAEARYRTLVEQLPAITYIVELGQVNRTIYISPQLEEVLGFSPQEWLADPDLWLKQLHLDDREWVVNETRRVEAGNEPLDIEYRAITKDGRTIWLHNLNQKVLAADESGQLRYRHGVMFDVTGRKHLEEQYQQAQKMEAIGQLTAGIAHDFNNLLTAINGFAGLMQLQLLPEDPLAEMVAKILHSGERAAQLIRQLLAFSRKQIIAPQLLELNHIVTKMDKLLSRIIGEHIQMKTDLAPDLWLIKADPAQIEQIIVNLAVNARDAMPEGGQLVIETANVSLDESFVAAHLETQPGEYVLLTITDTGHGMNEEVKAHLFEPFFTTKEQGKGTGLGLATVYGIVKQNGGYIWVDSEEGQGATFKIYLPRIREVIHPPDHPQVDAKMLGGSETILLVEDEVGVRELARRVLAERGYTVLAAPNGQTALDLATHHPDPIHLLLSDVVMPGISGRALAEQLHQTRPDLKVLFMSGYTDEAIAQHGILAPGVSLLQKPFSLTSLARKVREVLDSRP